MRFKREAIISIVIVLVVFGMIIFVRPWELFESSDSQNVLFVDTHLTDDEVVLPPDVLLEVFPIVDLGGRTIRLLNMAGAVPTSFFPEPLHYRIRRVEANFNVNIELVDINFIQGGEFSDFVHYFNVNHFSGDNFIDIISLEASRFNTLSDAGFFQEIDSIFMDLPSQWTQSFITNNGIFGFTPGNSANLILAYNIELFEGIDIISPSEMFFHGMWSWDDMTDYLYELRTLLPDDIELFAANTEQMLSVGPPSNGSFFMDPMTNVPNLDSENFIVFTEWFQYLVQNNLFIQLGVIPADSPYGTGEDVWTFSPLFRPNPIDNLELFRSGRLVFTLMSPSEISLMSNDVRLGVVPFPWGPEMQWPVSNNFNDFRRANFGSYSGSFNSTSLYGFVRHDNMLEPEILFNLLMHWDPHMATQFYDLTDDNQSAYNHIVHPPLNLSSLHLDLFRMYAADPLWNPSLIYGVFTRVPALTIAINHALATGGDMRTALESAAPDLFNHLLNYGAINFRDVPYEHRDNT